VGWRIAYIVTWIAQSYYTSWLPNAIWILLFVVFFIGGNIECIYCFLHCCCEWKTWTLFIISFIFHDLDYVLFLCSCLLGYWWVFFFVLHMIKIRPKTTRLAIGIFKMNIFVWLSYHTIKMFCKPFRNLSFLCLQTRRKDFVNQ
jgi:hypothetical protein